MAINNQMGGFGSDDPTMAPAPAAPTLNPAPIYSDPALGAAPAVGAETRGPPDPAAAFAATAPAAAPGAAPGGPPDPAAAFASSQPQYATETTKSTTTQGMSDKDIAEQRTANKGAEDAQGKAAASEGEQRRLEVEAQEQEQQRLLNEAAEQQKKIAAKQAVVDLENAEVKNKLQAGADWRPDRSELFSGSTGAARGILAAVAVMAGGWMQGRGMTRDNQFMSAIERMIDENVKDQVRHNSSTMQFLREQKGDIGAAAAELKARQMQYAMQKVNARAALSKIPAARQGVQAFNDAAAAKTAEWHAEQEKALRKSVSSTISKHTAPVQAAVVDPLDREIKLAQLAKLKNEGKAEGERTPQQARAESVTRSAESLGTKSGLQRDANGKWVVGKGALPPGLIEGAASFFGANTPIHDAAEQLAEQYGRLQSQGAIGVAERPEFREQVGMNTLTRAQLASKLNALEESVAPLSRLSDEKAHKEANALPESYKPLGSRN